MKSTDKNDQFQFWLMDMDDAIERLRLSVPADIKAKLDFSPDSLNILEAYVIEKYPNVAAIMDKSQSKIHDGLARYVGEVFRKRFKGKWKIDFSDEKIAFYGLPQLAGMDGQKSPICPLTLVTASLDRRTGKYLRTIFDNQLKRIFTPTPGNDDDKKDEVRRNRPDI